MNVTTNPLDALLPVISVGKLVSKAPTVQDGGFLDAMKQALTTTSQLQSESGRLSREVTFDNPTVSLEETMLAGVKSNIAFQATLQSRNRIVQAYTDVMNMQVGCSEGEAVRMQVLSAYYAVVQRVLRPGGLFLNHGITHDEEGWNRTVATEFINRYVFPDGELDCVSNIQLGMERAGFEIHDVEGLRPHYALTLRHWVERLEARREEALQEVGEVTYRIWRLYMAACALEFEAGGTGIHQIVASKRDRGAWPVPLTRRDLYRG